jgi:DNA-binding transcriptional LysR family regulator
MLRDGSLDLAVRSLSRATPGISSRPLLKVRRVIIASRRDDTTVPPKPTLAQLAERPFVLPWRGSTTRALLETALAAEGLPCEVALEAGHWEVVKLYVSQGLGIGLVPQIIVARGDERSLLVRPVEHLFPSERYGALLPENRPQSLAAGAFVSLLESQCQAGSGGNRR